MEEQLVINDLLSFIVGKIEIVPTDQLRETVVSFYNDEVISEAKAALYESIPKRPSTVPVLNISHDDDLSAIVTVLQMLREEDKPLIVCKDLNNLPVIDEIVKPDPDESMPSVMKKEQHVMKVQLRQMHDDIVCLKDGIVSLVDLDEFSDYESEDKENFTSEHGDTLHRSTNKLGKTKVRGGVVYGSANESEEDVEESIMLQADDGALPTKKFIGNNRRQKVIKLDNEGGVMTMVADDDIMQAGDPLSDAAKIEVIDGKPSKVFVPDSDDFYVIVNSTFHQDMGVMKHFRCSSCDYQSNRPDIVYKHKCPFGKSSPPLKCHVCSENVPDNFVLNSHLLRHNEVKVVAKYECSLCFHRTESFQAHLDHLDKHSWRRPYHCLYCPKYKSNLERAIRKHHIRHKETTKNGFICLLCEKICGTRSALNKHTSLHNRKMPFPCDTCGLTFPHKSALTQHKASHERKKEFVCPTCNFMCHTQHSLNVHCKSHSNDPKPSDVCDVCKIVFKNRTAKRNHMKKAHPGSKPFKCQECGECFRYLRNLYIHRKTHHKAKTRATKKCIECYRKFKTEKDLENHIKEDHYDILEEAPDELLDGDVNEVVRFEYPIQSFSVDQCPTQEVFGVESDLDSIAAPTMEETKRLLDQFAKGFSEACGEENDMEIGCTISYPDPDQYINNVEYSPRVEYIQPDPDEEDDLLFGISNGLQIS